ncbi:MAG: toll/interleukin-1 receptor domain-containing protein [Candidatus Thiodiazotropha sp. (ex Lucinoma borealis)]|nr:toll/interleukin-1 receptor domain-containing protein [Candidatus Thiodiazotropha sp. (ex Lucinoma borealis)]MCU7856714.1 toll/interleukin-1 receptor domain-containing protein [Candidatus Thiodiazotropha sp. (ex Lucinoma borealis)]MCU7870389.1 toll/interleukin-1 receptor domain-containing protein [Candidatus Thiodiazotropha sp. (ex Lucinoma borealis)]
MVNTVFLSYRRSDTSGHAGRICDDLERYFNRTLVFRDVESIDVGADFVVVLEKAIAAAKVAIVLIGDSWLQTQSDDGGRRLDDREDHVRREIETALKNAELTVIPVLVEDAKMPTEDELPESLHRLARLQAIELSEDRWDFDISRLVRVLERAGVEHQGLNALPAWVVALIGVSMLTAVGMTAWYWWDSTAGIDQYTGLWHLPNGGYWTVTERDGQLWVEETHHQSLQVWKRGAGLVDYEGMLVDLEPVFGKVDFSYRHRLRLSDDHTSLIGSQGRTDRESRVSIVLTRQK